MRGVDDELSADGLHAVGQAGQTTLGRRLGIGAAAVVADLDGEPRAALRKAHLGCGGGGVLTTLVRVSATRK